MIVHHDDQTHDISLQRDFDHVLIAETGMPKRVGNQLGDNELGIGQDVLGKVTDRPHPEARFPHRPYVMTERKARIAQLTALSRLAGESCRYLPTSSTRQTRPRLHRSQTPRCEHGGHFQRVVNAPPSARKVRTRTVSAD